VGFKHLIALQAGEHLHRAEGLILFIAAAVIMIALTTIGASSDRAPLFPQYLLAVAVLAMGFYADQVHKAVLAGVLVASCLGQGLFAGRRGVAAKRSTVSSPRAASALPNSQSA
jgi:hypothetical protein